MDKKILIGKFIMTFKILQDAAWHNYDYVRSYPDDWVPMGEKRIPISRWFILCLANTCILAGESLLKSYGEEEDIQQKECIQKFIDELKEAIDGEKIDDIVSFYTNFIFLWEDDNEDWIFKKK